MSEFKCEVVRVKLEPHPNADQIELCRVGDYISIVKKGQFREGDLAVYLPEQAILPEWMLKEMGFWQEDRQKGALNGAAGNRIKAVKLRGVLSQGIMFGGNCGDSDIPDTVLIATADKCPEGTHGSMAFVEGADAAEWLGIIKYEPAIPSHMRGNIIGVDYEATHKYDFDNLKKMPTMFDDGEDVVITEKIHGTLMQIGVVPAKDANEKYYMGRVIISSKGMGAKGYVLDHNDETNLYAQAAKKHGLLDKALMAFDAVTTEAGRPAFIFGEVFGTTLGGGVIQDLSYSGEALAFRAFDMCIGNRGTEEYAPWAEFAEICALGGIETVPVLYVGPYSKEIVLEHTDGNTTLTDKRHIREGVVVKSSSESRHPHFGRKIAKSVSEAYILRKGGATEFN